MNQRRSRWLSGSSLSQKSTKQVENRPATACDHVKIALVLLQRTQLPVQSLALQKLIMVTAFCHMPFLDYDYLVGFLYGAEPVGDHQRCAVFHQVEKCLLDQLLRF